MMRAIAILALLGASFPATAQQAADSKAGAMPTSPGETRADPPPADHPTADPENAADAVWGAAVMAPVRRLVYAEHGSMITSAIMIDRLEYHAQNGGGGYSWEGQAWYGGDYDRLWVKSRGESDHGGSLETAEVQALWSHAIDPWFNLQTGIRYDLRPRPDRAHLVLGVQGVAPYMFDIDVAAFLSDRGDLSARVETEYDQRITNRLILQPRAEINLAAQDPRPLHQGLKYTSIEAGLRLRYHFVPEFAPYFGVEYERDFGRVTQFTSAADQNSGGWRAVFGISAWF